MNKSERVRELVEADPDVSVAEIQRQYGQKYGETVSYTTVDKVKKEFAEDPGMEGLIELVAVKEDSVGRVASDKGRPLSYTDQDTGEEVPKGDLVVRPGTLGYRIALLEEFMEDRDLDGDDVRRMLDMLVEVGGGEGIQGVKRIITIIQEN